MEWNQKHKVHRYDMKLAWKQELFYSNMYPINLTISNIDTDKVKNTDIQYKFNEYGFRSDRFDSHSDISILTSGCSLTVGVAVNKNWTMYLKEMIQDYESKTVTAWNIATSGASSDYTVRSIYKVKEILKPTCIFVYWPPITRLELPNNLHSTTIEQIFLNDNRPPKGGIPKRLQTEMFFQMNFEKNRALYNSFNNAFENNKNIYFDHYARDGQHPNEEWHERVAEMFFEQYKAKYNKCSK